MKTIKVEITQQQAQVILHALNELSVKGKAGLVVLLDTINQIEEALKANNDQHDSDV